MSKRPDKLLIAEEKEEDDGYLHAEIDKEKLEKFFFYRRLWNKYDRSFLLVYGI